MKNKSETFYEIVYEYQYPHIKKKTVAISKNDKVEYGNDGSVSITLKDAWESPHNGDWSDEHLYGYKTFVQAKRGLAKEAQEEYKKRIKHINKMKEKKDDCHS